MAQTSDTKVTKGAGKGGMETFELEHSSGTTAVVYSHGATVTSVKNAAGHELIFVSGSAKWDNASPIRGGVPIIFPIFGAGWGGEGAPKGLPSHGFARRSAWTMDIVDDKVCFLLDNTAIGEEYAKAFPYSFALRYQLELSAEGVKTTLFVENKGDTAFEFQSLLHTYYNVDAIAAATFTGFKDCAFVDKLTAGDDEPSESRDVVTIGEETDRIYRAVKPGPYVIGGVTQSGGTAVSIEISTPDDAIDCVLWNPWIAKAAKMGDFGDDEYLNMVCVEPGFVAGPKTLAPGGTWFLGVESKAAKL